MAPIKPDTIRSLRLRYQRLASAPLRTPNDVVSWFGAMQSQEYAGRALVDRPARSQPPRP